MINLIILAIWVALGVGSAALFAAPGEPRFRWSPVALFLGPFWIAVESDRKKSASRGQVA